MNCPDPKLCERAKRHIHGRMYELYNTDEKYKKLIDNGFKEPSLVRKIISFAQAGINHLIDGENSSPEELERRLKICENCEFFNKDNQSCRQCGCRMNIKASWEESRCPLNKWSLPIVENKVN